MLSANITLIHFFQLPPPPPTGEWTDVRKRFWSQLKERDQMYHKEANRNLWAGYRMGLSQPQTRARKGSISNCSQTPGD